MAPNLPALTAGTAGRTRPAKTMPLFINLLEIDGNKPYHESLVVKGAATPKKRAEGSAKLSARSYPGIKKGPSTKVQII